MPHHSSHHRVRLKLKHISHREQKRLVKRSVLVVAIVEPALTLPQVYEIWVNHQAEGVSGLTWFMYIGAAVIWLLYGLQIKDKPLIISSILWVFMELAVAIGTVVYS